MNGTGRCEEGRPTVEELGNRWAITRGFGVLCALPVREPGAVHVDARTMAELRDRLVRTDEMVEWRMRDLARIGVYAAVEQAS